MEYKGLTIRENTLDKMVVDEVRQYYSLGIVPNATVLDIGANIGAVSRYAANIGARVIAVEPDPENFALLTRNTAHFPHVTRIQAAVVHDRSDAAPIILYKNTKTNMGAHSIIPTRGREQILVPTVEFRDLLTNYQPMKIKVDCEGAEYEFLIPSLLPSCVRAVMVELHLTKPGQRERAVDMNIAFLTQGWTYRREPKLDNKAWYTLASYWR
jgi:FkbM family methyltransferase